MEFSDIMFDYRTSLSETFVYALSLAFFCQKVFLYCWFGFYQPASLYDHLGPAFLPVYGGWSLPFSLQFLTTLWRVVSAFLCCLFLFFRFYFSRLTSSLPRLELSLPLVSSLTSKNDDLGSVGPYAGPRFQPAVLLPSFFSNWFRGSRRLFFGHWPQHGLSPKVLMPF